MHDVQVTAQHASEVRGKRENAIVERRRLVVLIDGIDGGEHVRLRCQLAVLDEQQRNGALPNQMPVDIGEQRPLHQIVMMRVLRDEPVIVGRGFVHDRGVERMVPNDIDADREPLLA